MGEFELKGFLARETGHKRFKLERLKLHNPTNNIHNPIVNQMILDGHDLIAQKRWRFQNKRKNHLVQRVRCSLCGCRLSVVGCRFAEAIFARIDIEVVLECRDISADG